MALRTTVIYIGLCACLCVPAHSTAKRKKAARLTHAKPAAPAMELKADDINNAALAPPLEAGATGSSVVRVQILLDRAHFSCGEIDGNYGSNLSKAVAAYQGARNLARSGNVDAPTWTALNSDQAPALVTYQIAPQDVAGPFSKIPADMMKQAKLPSLGYSSAEEELAERVHASPKVLQGINPGKHLDQSGEQILVPNTNVPPPGAAATVVVSKSESSVAAMDAQGHILAWYAATIGSEHDPLPIGTWKINGVSKNPSFFYNPDLFWDAKGDQSKAKIAPGPNNPVGVVWIDLSKEHYGIHGTPEPSKIGKTESHGCIRLTNWDAEELSRMVSPGTPAILQR